MLEQVSKPGLAGSFVLGPDVVHDDECDERCRMIFVNENPKTVVQVVLREFDVPW
jgi:hypothetical protein